MKVAFEGPPAAGKSTTAKALQASVKHFVIPEVNLLFERPETEPENWYLEHQVKRWQIAQKQETSYNSVIFDGDIFQPLWFSWIFSDENWPSIEYHEEFYRKTILSGHIGFPDKYIIFSLPEDERRNREYQRRKEMERDKTRIQQKYKKYQRIAEPQKKYFKAFQEKFPSRVQFLQSITLKENKESVMSLTIHQDSYSDIDIFEFLIKWLKTNKAEQNR